MQPIATLKYQSVSLGLAQMECLLGKMIQLLEPVIRKMLLRGL